MRADSAFYSRAVLGTARRLGVRFSITVRQDRRVRAAIDAIPDDAWAPIPYWLSTPDVSGADVAEIPYSCFVGTPHALPVRLVVRRVAPTPGSQLALAATAPDWGTMAASPNRAEPSSVARILTSTPSTTAPASSWPPSSCSGCDETPPDGR